MKAEKTNIIIFNRPVLSWNRTAMGEKAITINDQHHGE
jgi:hypothetical protein